MQTFELPFRAKHIEHLTLDDIREYQLPYSLGNLVLSNEHEQLIIPYSLIGGMVKTYRAYPEQDYTITLAAPAGSLQDHLKPLLYELGTDRLKEGTIDPTILKLYTMMNDHDLFLVGKGYDQDDKQTTLIDAARLRAQDYDRLHELYEQDKGLELRVTDVQAR